LQAAPGRFYRKILRPYDKMDVAIASATGSAAGPRKLSRDRVTPPLERVPQRHPDYSKAYAFPPEKCSTFISGTALPIPPKTRHGWAVHAGRPRKGLRSLGPDGPVALGEEGTDRHRPPQRPGPDCWGISLPRLIPPPAIAGAIWS